MIWPGHLTVPVAELQKYVMIYSQCTYVTWQKYLYPSKVFERPSNEVFDEQQHQMQPNASTCVKRISKISKPN